MGNLISLASGALGGLWGYLWAAALSAIAAGAGVGWTVHKIDRAAYVSLELADRAAKDTALKDAAAIQEAEEKSDLDAALAEAKAQQKIVTVTKTITKEVPLHVPDIVPCVPLGFVRLLDAAARGSDTAGAPAPAGQSDDACTSLSWRSLAEDLADDYGIGRANAEQLNALEANITVLVTAANVRP